MADTKPKYQMVRDANTGQWRLATAEELAAQQAAAQAPTAPAAVAVARDYTKPTTGSVNLGTETEPHYVQVGGELKNQQIGPRTDITSREAGMSGFRKAASEIARKGMWPLVNIGPNGQPDNANPAPAQKIGNIIGEFITGRDPRPVVTYADAQKQKEAEEAAAAANAAQRIGPGLGQEGQATGNMGPNPGGTGTAGAATGGGTGSGGAASAGVGEGATEAGPRDALDAQIENLRAAQVEQAKAFDSQRAFYEQAALQQKAQEDGIADAEKRRQESLNRYQVAVNKAANDLAKNAEVDPNRWWNSRDTFQKISAFLAIAGAGYFSKDGSNFALDHIGKAIQTDIEAQKATFANRRGAVDAMHNAYGQAMQRTQDARAAENLVRSAMLARVETGAKAELAKIQDAQGKMQMEEFIAKLQAAREENELTASWHLMTSKYGKGGRGGGGGGGGGGSTQQGAITFTPDVLHRAPDGTGYIAPDAETRRKWDDVSASGQDAQQAIQTMKTILQKASPTEKADLAINGLQPSKYLPETQAGRMYRQAAARITTYGRKFTNSGAALTPAEKADIDALGGAMGGSKFVTDPKAVLDTLNRTQQNIGTSMNRLYSQTPYRVQLQGPNAPVPINVGRQRELKLTAPFFTNMNSQQQQAGPTATFPTSKPVGQK